MHIITNRYKCFSRDLPIDQLCICVCTSSKSFYVKMLLPIIFRRLLKIVLRFSLYCEGCLWPKAICTVCNPTIRSPIFCILYRFFCLCAFILDVRYFAALQTLYYIKMTLKKHQNFILVMWILVRIQYIPFNAHVTNVAFHSYGFVLCWVCVCVRLYFAIFAVQPNKRSQFCHFFHFSGTGLVLLVFIGMCHCLHFGYFLSELDCVVQQK